jgi:serine/threonine protein phosphatase PrpC
VQFETALTTRLGDRPSNQDRCAVARHHGAVLLALADGMGGHARGDVAAQALVDCSIRQFEGRSMPQDDPFGFLRFVIETAHREIVQTGHAMNPPLEPRTTAVLCLVTDRHAWCIHAGDSRCYLLRDQRVVQRTLDHSLVEEMVQKGVIRPEEARTHPWRNMVTQCLGGSESPPRSTAGPRIELLSGDVILLCSDGLWSAVEESRLTVVTLHPDLEVALETLAGAAEAASRPASDNISAVALRCRGA